MQVQNIRRNVVRIQIQQCLMKYFSRGKHAQIDSLSSEEQTKEIAGKTKAKRCLGFNGMAEGFHLANVVDPGVRAPFWYPKPSPQILFYSSIFKMQYRDFSTATIIHIFNFQDHSSVIINICYSFWISTSNLVLITLAHKKEQHLRYVDKT